MTSYSTYGTSRIKLVDGTLTPEENRRNDDLTAVVHAVAAGAARALLDCTRDVTDPPNASERTEVNAEQWHSAEEGWELDAIHDNDRGKFLALVTMFVRQNLDNVLALANRIAWDTRFAGGIFAGDQGMAIYRVGMYLGCSGAGNGIGFEDYFVAEDLAGMGAGGNGRRYHGVPGRLSLWVDTFAPHVWEDTWIDSTEEPCLLHLSA